MGPEVKESRVWEDVEQEEQADEPRDVRPGAQPGE